jgi:hypothetical protein
MTDQEILEAEKLIADMRNDLALIAGTTDADKLAALVLEKAPHMVDSFTQVIQLGRVRDYQPMKMAMAEIFALADMAQRNPDYKAKLIDSVAKQVPIISSGFDKIAQALREKAAEPK